MTEKTVEGRDAVAGQVDRLVRPCAWINASGHPQHLSYAQSAAERRLHGPLQPLYDEQTLWNACARAAEVEKQRAATQIESLRELADSEGTRAVECLRRARNAEATLADALFVLGMVDKNNRIDAGETGKAWSGRFVADEVRRVLAGESGDDQAWDRNAERITREALGDDVTRPINPHATSIDDL